MLELLSDAGKLLESGVCQNRTATFVDKCEGGLTALDVEAVEEGGLQISLSTAIGRQSGIHVSLSL